MAIDQAQVGLAPAMVADQMWVLICLELVETVQGATIDQAFQGEIDRDREIIIAPGPVDLEMGFLESVITDLGMAVLELVAPVMVDQVQETVVQAGTDRIRETSAIIARVVGTVLAETAPVTTTIAPGFREDGLVMATDRGIGIVPVMVDPSLVVNVLARAMGTS